MKYFVQHNYLVHLIDLRGFGYFYKKLKIIKKNFFKKLKKKKIRYSGGIRGFSNYEDMIDDIELLLF